MLSALCLATLATHLGQSLAVLLLWVCTIQAQGATVSKTKLLPPDRKRCQAEIKVTPGARGEVIEGLESHGPIGAFMMGPQAAARVYRCEHPPIVIAREVRPAADGQRGSMSLCESCKAKMVEQCGIDFATFKPITARREKP